MAYGDHPGQEPMPTPSELAEQLTDEITAHKIRCRYCGAQIGQQCNNKITGHELRKFSVHVCRITDSKHPAPELVLVPASDDDDEELPF